MTARKPLVIVAGQTRQIAAGDTLDALSLPNPAAIPRGTAFPASPATNDLFYRTDLGVMCEWDGTRWLGMTQNVPMPLWYEKPPWSLSPIPILMYPITASIILSMRIVANVATTNNSTNYWNLILKKDNNATVSSVTTYPGTANANLIITPNIGVVTIANYLIMEITKQGSPGAIYTVVVLSYRQIYT